jgi:hypothetical protein
VKRKLGLFLLAVIAAVTLGATLVVSATMYRVVSAKQAQEIHDIEASLSERFTIFEVMLQSQHDRIAAHMAQVLPLIAREIEGLSIRPDKLTAGQMDELIRSVRGRRSRRTGGEARHQGSPAGGYRGAGAGRSRGGPGSLRSVPGALPRRLGGEQSAEALRVSGRWT